MVTPPSDAGRSGSNASDNEERPLHIVQIVPFMRPGLGIPSVAWNLDREFRAAGVETETFTFDTARRGEPFRYPRRGLARRLATIRRVLWFRFVGSWRARQFLAERPDAVAICHNEALAGDIFVYHGSTIRALRAAGRPWRDIILNPSQSIGYLHDRWRFRSRTHRVVVTLTDAGDSELRQIYGRLRPPTVTIPNGVDTERFAPVAETERRRLRAELQLDDEDRVALFIGHDLPGKRVDLAIAALEHAPTILLLVVGGDDVSIATAQRLADELGVRERVLFVGPQPDVKRFFSIADMFVFPSGYESFGLVVLEALSSGLPVIATPVGLAPTIVHDGQNGYLVSPNATIIGARLDQVARNDAPMRTNARESAVPYTWRSAACRYIEIAKKVRKARTS